MKEGNIIVVDDDKFMLKLCEAYLTEYEVKTFNSTESAEEFLKENPEWPDLVISDNDAPEENAGLKLGKFVKTLDCEFILMSGGNAKVLEALSEERGHPFFAKPFKWNVLLQTVKNIMDGILIS